WECGEFCLSLSDIGTVTGGSPLHISVSWSLFSDTYPRDIACVSAADLGRTVDSACLDQGSSKIQDYVEYDRSLSCDHNTGAGMAACELCGLVSCAFNHSASLFLWHHS